MTSQGHGDPDRQELTAIPKNVLIIDSVSQADKSDSLTYQGYNLGSSSGDLGPVTTAYFIPDGETSSYTADANPSAAGGLGASSKVPKAVVGSALTWLEDDYGNRSCSLRYTF